MDFYVAGEIVDALSIMTHRSEAPGSGANSYSQVKRRYTRQNFKVALQAAIGARFIAREDLSAYRKTSQQGCTAAMYLVKRRC